MDGERSSFRQRRKTPLLKSPSWRHHCHRLTLPTNAIPRRRRTYFQDICLREPGSPNIDSPIPMNPSLQCRLSMVSTQHGVDSA